MLRVKLICIGRLKEPYLRDACAEYQKRLSAFCRLEVEELTPARVPEAASDAQLAHSHRRGNGFYRVSPPALMCMLCVLRGSSEHPASSAQSLQGSLWRA